MYIGANGNSTLPVPQMAPGFPCFFVCFIYQVKHKSIKAASNSKIHHSAHSKKSSRSSTQCLRLGARMCTGWLPEAAWQGLTEPRAPGPTKQPAGAPSLGPRASGPRGGPLWRSWHVAAAPCCRVLHGKWCSRFFVSFLTVPLPLFFFPSPFLELLLSTSFPFLSPSLVCSDCHNLKVKQ